MSIKNFIYCMPVIISIMGMMSIFFAWKIRDKKNHKYIMIMNIISIIYLFVLAFLIPNVLPIIVDWNILIVWFISFIGGIFYLISLILCLFVKKNRNLTNNKKNIGKIVLIIGLMPIILFIITLHREIYLINHSTILLFYDFSGNGTVGDSYEEIYAISDRYCKEISIDIRYGNFFLLKHAKKIDEKELQKLDYKIILDSDNYMVVYKKNKLIHKKRMKKKFLNTDEKEIYYNQKG